MGGKSREDRWENQECVECGAKVDVGVRCKSCAGVHADSQKDRRKRKKDAKLCRVPGCRRKRVGKLTTCFECAFGKGRSEVEDWVELYERKLRSFRKL